MTHKSQGYFGSIAEGFSTLWQSLVVTFRHLFQARKSRKPMGVESDDYFNQDTGIVTLQYPFESFPIPDNGRYRLHNEIDDCIVCDLCAKICPVDCIDITPVKSPEEIGKTSDGTTKRLYAAQFDIDMAKCCYCGLCTTVCPTECLTMTKTYDYSEFDVTNMIYHFSDLSPEEAEKKKLAYAEAQKLKAASKTSVESEEKKSFKPTIKLPVKKVEEVASKLEENTPPKDTELKPGADKPKIVFKPKLAAPKAKIPSENSDNSTEPTSRNQSIQTDGTATTIGDNAEKEQNSPTDDSQAVIPPKPKIVFKPKINIPTKKTEKEGIDEKDVNQKPEEIAKTGEGETPNKDNVDRNIVPANSETTKPKIVFKPKIPGISKPSIDPNPPAKDVVNRNTIFGNEDDSVNTIKPEDNVEPEVKKVPLKPIIKPKIPGIKKPDSDNNPKE